MPAGALIPRKTALPAEKAAVLLAGPVSQGRAARSSRLGYDLRPITS